jgi:hypothetical protein
LYLKMAEPVTQFTLPISISTFTNEFWVKDTWYKSFLTEKLQDVGIEFTEWTLEQSGPAKVRSIKHLHPLNLPFFGLPSHTTSLKNQKMVYDEDKNELKIFEKNSFSGMPLCEYFNVHITWSAKEIPPSNVSAGVSCLVEISAEIIFLQSTWMQNIILSNTNQEMQRVYTMWPEFALLHIKNNNLYSKPQGTINVLPIAEGLDFDSRYRHVSVSVNDVETGYSTEGDYYDCEEYTNDISSTYDAKRDNIYNEDAIESEVMNDIRTRQMNSSTHSSPSSAKFHHWSSPSHMDIESNDFRNIGSSSNGSRYTTAIGFVEVLFVLTEASFWKVQNLKIYYVNLMLICDHLIMVIVCACRYMAFMKLI